jgi:hypothetical protein
MDKLKAFAKSMWDGCLSYLGKVASPAFYVGILVGVVYLVAKYRDVLISYLSWSSKQELNSATKQDAVLKTQEDSDNAKANALVDDANKLAGQGADPNWYKKD